MFPGIDLRQRSPTQRPPQYTVTGANVTIIPLAYPVVYVTLQASTTVSVSAGLYDGQALRIKFVQDASGAHTVSFDSTVGFGTDIASFTASTLANAVDFIGLEWDAVKGKWLFVAFARGY
jgi:hypothetical protein